MLLLCVYSVLGRQHLLGSLTQSNGCVVGRVAARTNQNIDVTWYTVDSQKPCGAGGARTDAVRRSAPRFGPSGQSDAHRGERRGAQRCVVGTPDTQALGIPGF